MNEPLVQEAMAALWATTERTHCESINNGLINHSFCATASNGQRVFLQQINKAVFLHPHRIATNLNTIYAALEKRNAAHLIAKPISFSDRSWLFCDANGQYWRAAEFVAAKTIHQTSDWQLLQLAVHAFANFTALLSDLPADQLYPTLDHFHDLSLRYEHFQQAILTGDPTRIAETSKLIEALLARKRYVKLYDDIINSPDDFKKRVMHHDAKLSNLLFDTTGRQVVAVSDLDTTMPGYFFSDLGDMVRSMTASIEENSDHPHMVTVLPAAYETIYNSYHQTIKDQLTGTEEALLHAAGLLMIYMQSLRFLSDYLQGDRYYQIKRPKHNHERAEHQYTLLCSLEELLKKNYGFSIS